MLLFKPYNNWYMDLMFNTGLMVHAAILIVGPILLFAGIWVFEVISRHNDTSNERPIVSEDNSADGSDALLGIYLWGSITIAPFITGHIAWQWCNAHQFEYFEAGKRTMMPMETASNIMAIAMFLSPIAWLAIGGIIALICMLIWAAIKSFKVQVQWGITGKRPMKPGENNPSLHKGECPDLDKWYD